MNWTPEQDQLLLNMCTEGRSYREIASKIMGDPNKRGAISGRLKRLAQKNGVTPLTRLSNTWCKWTPERDEMLRADYSAGLTYVQIAVHIFGDAAKTEGVVGRRKRLGLSRPKPLSRSIVLKSEAPKAVPKPSPKPAKIVPAELEPVEPTEPRAIIGKPEAPAERIVTMENIKSDECQWPIGDPSNQNFTFCGRKKSGDIVSPYCNEHRKIAHQPVRPAGKR